MRTPRGPSFQDRRDAGRRLAGRLAARGFVNAVVLGLPRGGVPVAVEVADRLRAPLDVLLVRKLGAPGQEELAIGAVVDGASYQIVRNDDIIAELGVDEAYIQQTAARELAVIERRRQTWLKGRPFPEVDGRTVIVVDDGIATGATVRAAVVGLRRNNPGRIVVAVPVSSREAIEQLRSVADEVIALEVPETLGAIGYFYGDFRQVSDAEVGEILRAHPHR
jgi:putative phosphoribosyl transferase